MGNSQGEEQLAQSGMVGLSEGDNSAIGMLGLFVKAMQVRPESLVYAFCILIRLLVLLESLWNNRMQRKVNDAIYLRTLYYLVMRVPGYTSHLNLF